MKFLKVRKGMKGISAVIATVLMLVITISLASTTYLYFNSAITQATQGIEPTDTFCDNGSVSMIIRNIGTNPITSINCLRTAPGQAAACTTGFPNINITPGSSTTFSNVDLCPGQGARYCLYRLTPNAGRTQPAQASCT